MCSHITVPPRSTAKVEYVEAFNPEWNRVATAVELLHYLIRNPVEESEAEKKRLLTNWMIPFKGIDNELRRTLRRCTRVGLEVRRRL